MPMLELVRLIVPELVSGEYINKKDPGKIFTTPPLATVAEAYIKVAFPSMLAPTEFNTPPVATVTDPLTEAPSLKTPPFATVTEPRIKELLAVNSPPPVTV